MITRADIAEIQSNNTRIWTKRIYTAGAPLLDAIYPNWDRHVDLYILDMSWQSKDILGQLYAGFDRRQVLALLFAGRDLAGSSFATNHEPAPGYTKEAELHGFIGCNFRYAHWIDSDLLTTLWVEHILNRRH